MSRENEKWIKGDFYWPFRIGLEHKEALEKAKQIRKTKKFDNVRVIRQGLRGQWGEEDYAYTIYVSGELAERMSRGGW